MANLPSVDSPKQKTETKQASQQKQSKQAQEIEAMGYMTRAVYAVLALKEQQQKFKRLTRWLDDTGATLADGKVVGDKKNRVVLWLIENADMSNV